MRFKRIISAVLVICFLMTMLPMNNVFASQTVASKGVSLTTDAAFFAKLNLSASGLASVKSAVNSGNYTSAKSALLAFYKDKFADLDVSYATAGNSSFNFLAMHDAVAFSEYYRGGVNITSSTATKYTINIGSDVAGVYVLSAVDPSTDFIGIYSSEHATASYRPQLKLYNSSGTLLKTLTATEDNTVRPSYAASKYCDSTINYVRHTVNASSYLPYSNDSMRTYIKFDTSQIPSTAKKAELVVYAKLGTDKTTLVGDPIHLCVMGAYYKGWSESSLSWSSLVSGNYLGHFSWNGLSGGFNWKKPSGTPSEWLNYNTRFYELSSLVQAANKTTNTTTKNSYMTKVKNMLIDFINDAGAGIPASRDIEPANRCMEFPYIYKWLLAGDYITADENVKILSWLYDEATLLYKGVGLFSGTSTVLSDLVYTNRGFWHVAGLYDCIAFFKEFTESALWNNVFAPRLKIVSNTLIHDDGSYNEVTFGYPGSVVGWSSHMLASMRIMGDTSSTASNFSIKLAKMVKYVVDCTYPGGTPPHWGQGGPSATKTVVTQFLNSIGTTYDYLTEVQELRYYLNHSNGTEPDTSSQYNEIKIVTDRTGWDSTDSMIFMNAKIGGNHGHRDSLALLFYYGGKALLTDTGMTSYDNSHAHFSFQNSRTVSHNTIEIDSTAQIWKQNLSDTAHLSDIDISANDFVSTITSWTKATTGFTHYRNVAFIKELGDVIIVTDKVVPGDSSTHTYTQNWHSTPNSNAAIASDVYKTGTTSFASGSNLIIAQTYNPNNTSLNASISASLQSGYDSSSASTTTKFFQYKQTKAGTVTYNTVLYPKAAGSSATIEPQKLSLGVEDDVAMGTRIAINNGDNGANVIYFYNSFESTPSSRTFGGHTTNASTAVIGLNSGSTVFASISNGSSLVHNSKNILYAPVKVSDLSASVDGTTLKLASSHTGIEGMELKAYMSGTTFTSVTVNGSAVGFTQASDGTVTTQPGCFIVDFDGSDALSSVDSWTKKNATATIDTASGIMYGNATAGDPYIALDATGSMLNYEINSGDIIEIRVKNKVTSGSADGIQVFYSTTGTKTYQEAYSIHKKSLDLTTGAYQTITLGTFKAAHVGETINALRIDMFNAGSGTFTGTYEIDYIYIGDPEKAPSKTAVESTPIPTVTATPAPTFTLSEAVTALSNAYDTFASSGSMPVMVTINGTILNEASYTWLAAKAINAIVAGSSAAITYVASDAPSAASGNFSSYDSFGHSTINKTGYTYVTERFITFFDGGIGSTPGVLPNYTTFPGSSSTSYSGQFSYMRAVVVFARVLNYYKKNGVLPDTVDAGITYTALTAAPATATPTATPTAVPTAVPSGSFTIAEVAKAAATALEGYTQGNAFYVSGIVIDGVTVSQPNYYYIAAQAIQDIYNKNTTAVYDNASLSVNAPNMIANYTFNSEEVSQNFYMNFAVRQTKYIDGTGAGTAGASAYYPTTSSNENGFPATEYSGQFTYEAGLLMFTRILAAYYANGSLPATVAVCYVPAVEQTAAPTTIAPTATPTVAPTTTPSDSFTIAEIASAAKAALEGYTSGTPFYKDGITIGGVTVAQQNYYIMAAQAIQDIYNKNTTATYANASYQYNVPEIVANYTLTMTDGSDATSVPQAFYMNFAIRQTAYVNGVGAGTVGAMAAYPTTDGNANGFAVADYTGQMTYEAGLLMFSRILAAYAANGSLPASVALEYVPAVEQTAAPTTVAPTATPTATPTVKPTATPTVAPTTVAPTTAAPTTVAPTTAAPTATATTAPTSITLQRKNVLYAAYSINKYLSNNTVTFPNYSSIDGNTVYMPGVLDLIAQVIVDINNGSTADIVRTTLVTESDISYEQLTAGMLTRAEYVELAQGVLDYIAENGTAPGMMTTSLGTLSFETTLSILAKIGTTVRSTGVLPESVEVEAWGNPLPVPPEVHATEFELNNVLYAAYSVNSYVTKNSKFPNYASIEDEKVYMFEALGLFAQMIINLSGGDTGVVTRNDATFFETAYENITGTTLTKTQYVKAAQAVLSAVNSSPISAAPGFVNTAAGALSYQTLLKTFASIGATYRSSKALPESVEVSAWTATTLPTPPATTATPEYTYLNFKNVLAGAARVQRETEAIEAMPNYVTVGDSRLYQGTMLRMFASTVANISRGKAIDMPLMEVATPSRIAAETITACSLTKTEYISLANRIAETIYKNNALPNYCTTTEGTMNHYSMIYMYARILNFYLTYGFLPDTIAVQPFNTYEF